MQDSEDQKTIDLTDRETVLRLAEAERYEQSGIPARDVRKVTQEALDEIDDLIRQAYELSFLEAKAYCDEYHEGKNSLGDLGATYGYLNSYVQMNRGTIEARFQVKRPSGSGYFDRQHINHGVSGGYSEVQLKKHSAHEYEAELAMMTEEHYARIRAQGKKLKEMQRALRKIEIFRRKDNKES